MAYQGHYDGLCGMYAIANAFMECGVKDGEEVFHTACTMLAQKRWPKTLVQEDLDHESLVVFVQ